ncbi:MAG TPA: DUF72 domain-containing protein [Gemmataceae bacterium]|nr:DUF72 domain-containing protein [Gemmataceae bacterium]
MYKDWRGILYPSGLPATRWFAHYAAHFDTVTGRLAYVRFHGPTERAYHGRYGRDLLRPWAETIAAFRAKGRDVFVYFNNCFDGAALADARDLRDLLEVAPAAT